jgi:hypothetical protein
MTQTQVRIGSEAMAARFASGDIPADAVRLGSGSYRVAYLAPDGVVYKVMRHSHGSSQSALEAQNAAFYREKHDKEKFPGWEIPEFTVYNFDGKPIVATPHQKGEHSHSPAYCEKRWEFDAATKSYPHEKEECEKCKALDLWNETENIPAEQFASSIGYYDMHSGNYIIREDGMRVLIDCG